VKEKSRREKLAEAGPAKGPAENHDISPHDKRLHDKKTNATKINATKTNAQQTSDSFERLPEPSSGSQKVVTPGEMAKEMSMGAWRERAFAPRVVMSAHEIVASLEQGRQRIRQHPGPTAVAVEVLRRDWAPVLRQALERAGGDGLDRWLSALLDVETASPRVPLFSSIVFGFDALRQCTDGALLDAQISDVIDLVRVAVAAPAAAKLSLKVAEHELEGKLDVEELLLVATATEPELTRRAEEVATALETLRRQIRSRPGTQPGGMYASFARLSTELRVVRAQLQWWSKHR
jgi:hypothetical protein